AGFSAGCNCDVSQIDLALRTDDQLPGSADISIWTSASGAPATELGSWLLSDITDVPGTEGSIFTISGITGISLDLDTQYFIELSWISGEVAWNGNGEG